MLDAVKSKVPNAEIRLFEVNPRLYLVPRQALRVWVFLVSRGLSVVRTTPGELLETLRNDGLKISNRALSQSLAGLEYAGAISVDRRGHMLTIGTGVIDG